MRHLADIPRWCDDVTDSASPTRFARRSLLKAAVLGRRDESDLSFMLTEMVTPESQTVPGIHGDGEEFSTSARTF